MKFEWNPVSRIQRPMKINSEEFRYSVLKTQTVAMETRSGHWTPLWFCHLDLCDVGFCWTAEESRWLLEKQDHLSLQISPWKLSLFLTRCLDTRVGSCGQTLRGRVAIRSPSHSFTFSASVVSCRLALTTKYQILQKDLERVGTSFLLFLKGWMVYFYHNLKLGY